MEAVKEFQQKCASPIVQPHIFKKTTPRTPHVNKTPNINIMSTNENTPGVLFVNETYLEDKENVREEDKLSDMVLEEKNVDGTGVEEIRFSEENEY